MAALKICLLAMGIMIGMAVPEKDRKKTFSVCVAVYAGTVIPLVKKYVDILLGEQSGKYTRD